MFTESANTGAMVSGLLLLMAALGLVLSSVFACSLRRHIRSESPPLPNPPPPVSVLKPLKGLDPGLEENLESCFVLDYPEYEVILGLDAADDPAYDVARRVVARHPERTAQLVVSPRCVGFNPKVNNLANMAATARHEHLLVSDSNVKVPPRLLAAMVARLESPGVGLVTSLIRGVGGTGLGAALESLQLNTFVMGGAAAVERVAHRVCSVGKSMLLRRRDLESIGGFSELGRYLAEDQVCGEALAASGLRAVVDPLPVDNVLGALDVRQFVRRHLRWARIRRHMHPWFYFTELLLNPVMVAVVCVVVAPGATSISALVGSLMVMSLLAWRTERTVGVHRPAVSYPLLELLRELLVVAVWIVPFLDTTVTWRGARYRIRRRTELRPIDGTVKSPSWSVGSQPDACS